jgi:hypothetical protein
VNNFHFSSLPPTWAQSHLEKEITFKRCDNETPCRGREIFKCNLHSVRLNKFSLYDGNWHLNVSLEYDKIKLNLCGQSENSFETFLSSRKQTMRFFLSRPEWSIAVQISPFMNLFNHCPDFSHQSTSSKRNHKHIEIDFLTEKLIGKLNFSVHNIRSAFFEWFFWVCGIDKFVASMLKKVPSWKSFKAVLTIYPKTIRLWQAFASTEKSFQYILDQLQDQ